MKFFRRRWVDFRTGHSMYLLFLISFSNFIAIQYRLIVEQVPFLETIFPHIWIFIVTFVLIYIPVAIVIGLWHRKTQVKVETELTFKRNPMMARNFRMILDAVNGKLSEEQIKKYRDTLISIEKGKGGKV